MCIHVQFTLLNSECVNYNNPFTFHLNTSGQFKWARTGLGGRIRLDYLNKLITGWIITRKGWKKEWLRAKVEKKVEKVEKSEKKKVQKVRKTGKRREKGRKSGNLGLKSAKSGQKKLKRGSFSNLRKFEPSLSLLFCMLTLSLPRAYIRRALGSLLHTIEEHTPRGSHHLLHPQP